MSVDDLVSCDFDLCPVVAMGPPTPEPHVMVGANPDWTFGPAVLLGVGATMPGATTGLALVAHMGGAMALSLAEKLKAAAEVILAAEAKGNTVQ